METLGGDLFVRKATLEYLGSARYDDVLDIGMRCARIGTSSIVFVGGAFRQEQLLVTCELTYVFADPHAQRLASRCRASCATLFDRFEAGESMVDVRVGTWARARRRRRGRSAPQVFVAEQKIPAEMEWDDADDGAVHAVACNRLGRAAGDRADARARARRRQDRPDGGGRAAARHSGVGRAVLDALLDAARAPRRPRGGAARAARAPRRSTSAPASSARGPEFDEAGIAHVEMLRAL